MAKQVEISTEDLKKEIANAKEIIAPETELTPFLEGLNSKNDSVIGIFLGHRMIDLKGDKGLTKLFLIKIDGKEFYLPSHSELNKKLTILDDMKKGTECVVEITIVSVEKLSNNRKLFKYKVVNS